jgi:hypothetical protein
VRSEKKKKRKKKRMESQTTELLNEQIYQILSKSEFYYGNANQDSNEKEGDSVNIEEYFQVEEWKNKKNEGFQKKVAYICYYLLKELEHVANLEVVGQSESILNSKSNIVEEVKYKVSYRDLPVIVFVI